MNRLKRTREAQQLTLRELAYFVGVSHTRLWQLEQGGDAPAALKVKVARALDVPVADLFPRQEEPKAEVTS